MNTHQLCMITPFVVAALKFAATALIIAGICLVILSYSGEEPRP